MKELELGKNDRRTTCCMPPFLDVQNHKEPEEFENSRYVLEQKNLNFTNVKLAENQGL